MLNSTKTFKKMDKLKIAMIGTKGIPARLGGIEKYIEEIAKRLVSQGHAVTVFGSRWYCENPEIQAYHGVRVRWMPTIRHQSSDALINALLATISITFMEFDIVHFHGYASYYFIPFIKCLGKKTVITAHGVESGWDNPKYGAIAKKVIEKAFTTGVSSAHKVTAVSEHIRDKIIDKYNIIPAILRGGMDSVEIRTPYLIRKKFGLQGSDYLLFLGRIDPIKRVHWLLELTRFLKGDLKVVIAGGAQGSTTENYLRSLIKQSRKDSKLIFTGPVFGELKEELLSNCLLFLSPSFDEGLPLALLEATAYSKCCVASDIAAHREVIDHGSTGYLFPRDDKSVFSENVQQLISKPHEFIEKIGLEAEQRAKKIFSWETTTIKTAQYYRDLLNEN